MMVLADQDSKRPICVVAPQPRALVRQHIRFCGESAAQCAVAERTVYAFVSGVSCGGSKLNRQGEKCRGSCGAPITADPFCSDNAHERDLREHSHGPRKLLVLLCPFKTYIPTQPLRFRKIYMMSSTIYIGNGRDRFGRGAAWFGRERGIAVPKGWFIPYP